MFYICDLWIWNQKNNIHIVDKLESFLILKLNLNLKINIDWIALVHPEQ